MYELADYLAMIDDRRRTAAYLDAMSRVIRSGDRVLELGTGFGFFAIHAARLGTSHVWAIEPNDAIGFGPALAAEHGVADRITFIQALSTRVTLPDRADVLVEDLRGTSPLMQGRIPALLDARARHLVPRPRVIPLRDRLMVAPTGKPRHAAIEALDDAGPIADIDISAVRRVAREGLQRISAMALTPLAEPACWATLDYATLASADAQGDAEFRFGAATRIEGFASWFEAELASGIGFSSGPGPERSVYDCAWLPLARAIDVAAGDSVILRLRAKHDGSDYVWVWDVDHHPVGGPPAATVRHTNLRSLLRTPASRARRAATHVPRPTRPLAQVAALARLVDGHRSLGEIARALRSDPSSAFTDDADALRWAGEALARLDG